MKDIFIVILSLVNVNLLAQIITTKIETSTSFYRIDSLLNGDLRYGFNKLMYGFNNCFYRLPDNVDEFRQYTNEGWGADYPLLAAIINESDIKFIPDKHHKLYLFLGNDSVMSFTNYYANRDLCSEWFFRSSYEKPICKLLGNEEILGSKQCADEFIAILDSINMTFGIIPNSDYYLQDCIYQTSIVEIDTNGNLRVLVNDNCLEHKAIINSFKQPIVTKLNSTNKKSVIFSIITPIEQYDEKGLKVLTDFLKLNKELDGTLTKMLSQRDYHFAYNKYNTDISLFLDDFKVRINDPNYKISDQNRSKLFETIISFSDSLVFKEINTDTLSINIGEFIHFTNVAIPDSSYADINKFVYYDVNEKQIFERRTPINDLIFHYLTKIDEDSECIMAYYKRDNGFYVGGESVELNDDIGFADAFQKYVNGTNIYSIKFPLPIYLIHQ